MGMPEFPQRPDINVCDALTDIIESIAIEELAIAHFVNAEAEKIQAIAAQMVDKHAPETSDVIDFQRGVAKVMRNIIKKQMLLQFKFEDAVEALKDCDCMDKHHHGRTK